MKIVIGLFSPEAGAQAFDELKQKSFREEDLSMHSSVSEVPHYIEDEIEGEPEKSVLQGAAIGALIGGTLAAFAAWAATAIPGFEFFSLDGLLAIAAGGTIGAFLGSLYRTRAETQTYLDIHKEIESGKVLLVVRTEAPSVDEAEAILKENGGQDVEVHELSF